MLFGMLCGKINRQFHRKITQSGAPGRVIGWPNLSVADTSFQRTLLSGTALAPSCKNKRFLCQLILFLESETCSGNLCSGNLCSGHLTTDTFLGPNWKEKPLLADSTKWKSQYSRDALEIFIFTFSKVKRAHNLRIAHYSTDTWSFQTMFHFRGLFFFYRFKLIL